MSTAASISQSSRDRGLAPRDGILSLIVDIFKRTRFGAMFGINKQHSMQGIKAVLYAPTKPNHGLFANHKQMIEQAVEAVHKRTYWSPFPEMPSPDVYGATAEADQKQKYEQQLGQKFSRLRQSHDTWLKSDEQSPYTQKDLGVTYPSFAQVQDYIKASEAALAQWRRTDVETRAGILAECLDRMKASFYEIAFSTMHTTGQSYLMSFQASGPHAADRALEALALGYHEIKRFPTTIEWEKPAGKVNLKLEKHYTVVPRGVSVAIGCATFPIWNTLPGVFASLITANTAIVKPHPNGIYPIAIVVAIIQEVLVENGFSADIVMLAPDNANKLITKELAEHPAVKIIDFTGSSTFGKYIESLPGKITFTEKSGVNSVIIDSAPDLNAMAQNLAFSLSLYSGQMCTAPQNIFVPKGGIKSGDSMVTFEQVEKAIVDAVTGLATHPKAGPAVLGAIQSQVTSQRVKEATNLGGKVLLESKPIQNPEFPDARTSSPIVIEISPSATEIFQREMFGPIAFVIPTDSTEQSVQLAAQTAKEHGAISCGAYTQNEEMMERIAEAMAEAGTSVSFNFTGNIYVNQNASFSDFHVTGANPSGNASLTDPEFVLKRFTRVQSKVNR
jgi:phenylacetic acid degradation protein paaN